MTQDFIMKNSKKGLTEVTVIILMFTNILLWMSTIMRTSGPSIRADDAKTCAKKWLETALETSDFDVKISSMMEHVDSEPLLITRNKFASMLPCITHVNLYNNSFAGKHTLAYVLPWAYSNKMWVNSRLWNNQNTAEKAYTIIHECTHLALKMNDYAYLSQEKYANLRGYNATHNADTITKIIANINYFNC